MNFCSYEDHTFIATYFCRRYSGSLITVISKIVKALDAIKTFPLMSSSFLFRESYENDTSNENNEGFDESVFVLINTHRSRVCLLFHISLNLFSTIIVLILSFQLAHGFRSLQHYLERNISTKLAESLTRMEILPHSQVTVNANAFKQYQINIQQSRGASSTSPKESTNNRELIDGSSKLIFKNPFLFKFLVLKNEWTSIFQQASLRTKNMTIK